jgi:NADH:ubiquinone oxidoreductase subunit 5 (subunit L)/multisubunit Na+/H+ antiporter MnhA subunit
MLEFFYTTNKKMSTCSTSPPPDVSSTGRTLLIVSSALFFIPTALSFFRQSIVVTLIYFFSALFSTLYHANNEQSFSDEDVTWATFAILISLILLAVLTVHYPIWNWRIIVPILFGVAGIVIYVTEGQLSEAPCDHADDTYTTWHNIWHLLMAIAATVLVWTPVDLSEANMTYIEMYKKSARNNQKTPLNLESFKK